MATHSISGSVFLDQSGDGSYQAGDVLQVDCTVLLLNSAGDTVATTTTLADGSYSFAGLANGRYSVAFTAPSGDQFSTPLSGNNGNGNGNEDGGGTQTSVAVTVANANVTGVDAGLYAPVSISGTVFSDSNGNGLVDGTDKGLGGVTVQLLNAAGQPTGATTTTASNGSYRFTGLQPGTYSVQVDQVSSPAGALFSQLGSNTAPQPTGGTVTTQNNLLVNGNFNGLTTGGSYSLAQGLSGWTVSSNTPATPYGSGPGAGVELAVTNGSTAQAYQPGGGSNPYAGKASEDQANQNYYGGSTTDAAFFVDDGAVETLSQTVNLTAGQVYEVGFDLNQTLPGTGNPGFFQLSAALGGTVITTASSTSGVGGGTALPGGQWIHFADLYTATTSGPTTLTFTYASGTPGSSLASKDVLVDNVYIVPGQVTPTLTTTSEVNAAGITAPVTLTSGQSVGNESAGIYLPPATISGTVFLDANGDGALDGSEAGLAGRTVNLTANGTVIATTVTAANGSYSFGNLAAGSYVVRAEAPGGTLFSTTTNTTTLNSAQNAVVNVGEYRSASIGGSVFLDQNDNGVQNSGEANLAGVSVSLLNAAGQPVAGETTTTDQTGHYSFTGLNPGSYSVQIAAPTGDVFSPLGTAAPPATDNLANAQGVIGGITLVSGENSAGNNAGVAATGELRSMVFFDGNNSGTYHVGDAGVAGVTVNLYDAHGIFVASAVTDSSGQYDFKNLAAGSYAVQVVAPSGTSFSAHEAASGNPLLDSDVNSSGSSATLVVTSSNTTQGANAGLVFNGAFAGQSPAVLADGQQYASFTGGQVVVGAGDNNVHTGASGNNVVVLGGSGNVIELGFNTTTVQDIGVSAGAMQAQTQQAQNGFLFAGGSGASYLDGGAGNAYLMGGTGANQIYSGSGRTTIIAGGNGSLVTTGGISTAIAYQAGDGQLTIDNGLRTQDSLTVYGYSGGTIETVNSIQELVLSPSDVIAFSGATSFADGATTGGNGLNFVASITAPPMEELSFVNGLPVFTAQAAPAAPTLPAEPAVPLSNIVTSNSAADLTLASTTTIVNLTGYNNIVTGTNTGVSIAGDQGNSTFQLGNGNNQLVLSGYHDQIMLGDGNNTVSGSAGNTTITAGDGGNTITLGGYDNTITLGDGNNTLVAGQGNENIVAGAGNNTIIADGYNNRITVAGGASDIIAGRGNETVDVGSSTATITLDGYANVVIGGQSHVIVSGGADNTYQINGFGDDGGMTINGFAMNNGDVLDLSTVMSHTDWNHEANTLSNYLNVSEHGNDTVISVSSGGASGHFATAATLQNIGPTSLGDLQAHHAISLF